MTCTEPAWWNWVMGFLAAGLLITWLQDWWERR